MELVRNHVRTWKVSWIAIPINLWYLSLYTNLLKDIDKIMVVSFSLNKSNHIRVHWRKWVHIFRHFWIRNNCNNSKLTSDQLSTAQCVGHLSFRQRIRALGFRSRHSWWLTCASPKLVSCTHIVSRVLMPPSHDLLQADHAPVFHLSGGYDESTDVFRDNTFRGWNDGHYSKA